MMPVTSVMSPSAVVMPVMPLDEYDLGRRGKGHNRFASLAGHGHKAYDGQEEEDQKELSHINTI